MKTFSTVSGAFNFVKKNLNTGNELIMNDRIHFGVGSTPYVYSNEVAQLNLEGLKPSNWCFTHLENDEQLERAISFALQTDGYLAI